MLFFFSTSIFSSDYVNTHFAWLFCYMDGYDHQRNTLSNFGLNLRDINGRILFALTTSGPFTCIFSETSLDFFLCWLWLTHGSCVGPHNKIGHPAGCRFPRRVPAEYKAKKHMTCGTKTCEMTNFEIE